MMIRQPKLDEVVTAMLQEKNLTFSLERENLIKSSYAEGWLTGYKLALAQINQPKEVKNDEA